jgi:hypothetical protein
MAALLGGGLLAGCGHSAPVAQGAASSATPVRSTVTAEPTALSAPDLLSAAQAAVRSAGSVHADVTDTSDGATVRYTDDATATGGREVVTIGQTRLVTFLLINRIGYVQGTAAGLEAFAKLTGQQAQQFADQWIEVRPGQKLGSLTFSDVTEVLSLPSIASVFTLSGTPSLVKPTTIGGQPVDGLLGTPAPGAFSAPATFVLYVADGPQRVPVHLSVQGKGYSYQMTFSHWHEAVQLTAPTGAIPATDVRPPSSIT